MTSFDSHSSTGSDDTEAFQRRHIGPRHSEQNEMLRTLGEESLANFIAKVIPEKIQLKSNSADDFESGSLGTALTEQAALEALRVMSEQNVVKRSMIGQGYYDCYLPSVLVRNVLESPSWYTSYTPYQPEISQGRLEVLFNFQTMITELTGMDTANASLLDEATATAEAVSMCHRIGRGKRSTCLLSDACHPQTLDVVATRAEPLQLNATIVSSDELEEIGDDVFAVVLQYPATDGSVVDWSALVSRIHEAGAQVIFVTDLLALTLLKNPASMGADVVVGSAQRFGVPMGFGGPHAAFMATSEKNRRSMPGRLIGLSIDASGNDAYRLALQTREQHIRREKATSNICTAQALLAILATLYACYHGPEGLKAIAHRVHRLTSWLAIQLENSGVTVLNKSWFDTLHIQCDVEATISQAESAGFNLRRFDENSVCVSLDETTTLEELVQLLSAFRVDLPIDRLVEKSVLEEVVGDTLGFSRDLMRTDRYLSQYCFHQYHSETSMMRYLRQLADKDLALDRTMIPLGSCTMKLNSATEMMPISWRQFATMHPFAPVNQTKGYQNLINDLEAMLCACTGYSQLSLQPNAGSQGEYAGLLAIKRYHESNGQGHRDVCLIPSSAHGTNPASAQMVGMRVVVVDCDLQGNIDIEHLRSQLDQYTDKLAAIMITYPSTHGVFEDNVVEVCQLVHEAGGQVYIDGANLNAMVGLAAPGEFGGDVSHLNLHKTFCIPHGGGGPGVGPIGVSPHLSEFLPGHRYLGDSTGVVSAAPSGSALILPITWMYLKMMGAEGLRTATSVAILSANYIANRLSGAYPVLYTGASGYVAHECILDTRIFKESAGITVDDIAKRLIDYGFHAPTMSFPVAGTLMIEPTESESKEEIDRFCDAMLSIREEIARVESGDWSPDDNPLVNAPHTADVLLVGDWNHAYSRQEAAYPTGVSVSNKYWPPVGRVDNVHGDKNLVCSCPPIDSYRSEPSNLELEEA